MPKVQPGGEIGPNNAGKMILRGCFMDISQEWLDASPIGVMLNNYLNNRNGEATAIKLNYGGAVPDREHGLNEFDMVFMTNVIEALTKLEKSGAELRDATDDDIFDQATDQILVVKSELEKYEAVCSEKEIRTMFTGVPSVIMANVQARTAVTHEQSMAWEDVQENLFEGLEVVGVPEVGVGADEHDGGYEPPAYVPPSV